MFVVVFVILLLTSLFFATRGEYPVVPLGTEDVAVPSQMIEDIKLHMRIVKGPVNAATIIALHGGPSGDFRSLQGLDALSDDCRIVYCDQRGARRELNWVVRAHIRGPSSNVKKNEALQITKCRCALRMR